jgi:ATP-dependent Clp protease adapter protein ClpS
MPAGAEIAEPIADTRVFPDLEEDAGDIDEGPYVVILYNDEVHSMDEVIAQLMKATAHPIQRCIEITMEAHTRGRAIAWTGSSAACERTARILRQIRLQVETDKF